MSTEMKPSSKRVLKLFLLSVMLAKHFSLFCNSYSLVAFLLQISEIGSLLGDMLKGFKMS